MQINILTIFPEFFRAPLQTSILGRASKKKLVQYRIINLRDFAQDKHQTTDQRPFGGGPGMVMMIEPIDLALRAFGVAKGQEGSLIILTAAKGQLFTQRSAQTWSNLKTLTIICGHYEGVDERVARYLVDVELRIGDYVLSGGESAALVLTDAVVRLVPDVLGNEASKQNESHSQFGKLAAPQYTQPATYRDWSVPTVLRSGDHAKISQWRSEHEQQERK